MLYFFYTHASNSPSTPYEFGPCIMCSEFRAKCEYLRVMKLIVIVSSKPPLFPLFFFQIFPNLSDPLLSVGLHISPFKTQQAEL
jgi:hypothetical protein